MKIKFKAISVYSGEMVFGSYVTDGDDYHAIVYPCIDDDTMMRNDIVDADTVAQFTGVTNRNGVEIYRNCELLEK